MAAGTDRNLKALGSANHRPASRTGTCRFGRRGTRSGLRIDVGHPSCQEHSPGRKAHCFRSWLPLPWAQNEPRSLGAGLLSILAAVIGSAIIAATIYLCYVFADRLAVLLGPTGTNVIVKLSSFLLVCIGVQIVWNGVSQLLRSLPHPG